MEFLAFGDAEVQVVPYSPCGGLGQVGQVLASVAGSLRIDAGGLGVGAIDRVDGEDMNGDDAVAMEIALPYRSDWREMSSVLDYCKGKGADRSSLEARFGGGESLRETLNALEQLGLVERSDGGDARLTGRGEALAYAPDQARLRERLVEAMLGYAPYRFPLERALAAESGVLDGPWVEHIWQVDMRLGQPRNRVEEARTFFYRLADEAGLGVYRRGVRGQTTRLELAGDFGERLGSIVERIASESQSGAASRPVRREVAPVDAPVVLSPGRPGSSEAQAGALDGRGAVSAPAQAALSQPAPVEPGAGYALPGLPQGISIQLDMSNWELERIEDFLRLIGYLPPR